MFDLGHTLNGKNVRQHQKDMIREAQRAKFAREVKANQTSNKPISSLRTILLAIINLVIKTS